MAPSMNSFNSSNGPVMALSPSPSHASLDESRKYFVPAQPFHKNSGTFSSASNFTTPSPFTPTAQASNVSQWTPPDSMTPISTNPSRKRSRDDSNIEEAGYFAPTEPLVNNNTAAMTMMSQPAQMSSGEGMALVNPLTGQAVSSPLTQTGTWLEESQEAQKYAAQAHAARPIVETMSRKSQRLDTSASSASFDDVARAAQIENSSISNSPPKFATNPHVDDFTLLLGVGWTRLSDDDPHIQAAARGWARFIDNHYPDHIHGAQILLKSRSTDSYLVGSAEGAFWLFSEDLTEGKLVGHDEATTLANLRKFPIQFEGMESIRAARSPSPSIMPMPASNAQVQHMDVQMQAQAALNNGYSYSSVLEFLSANGEASGTLLDMSQLPVQNGKVMVGDGVSIMGGQEGGMDID